MRIFNKPVGVVGLANQIKWCGRWEGGKYCLFCNRYAVFKDWSNNWHWHYLLYWTDCHGYFQIGSHMDDRYLDYNTIESLPKRYKTPGLKYNELNMLIKKGCKINRKCRCIKPAQRASWFCPECYNRIYNVSLYRKQNIHDVIMENKEDVNSEYLILLLSKQI